MLSVFLRSLRDFFDLKILFISLLPITIAALLWAAVFYVFADQIHGALLELASRVPYMESELAVNAVELVGGVLIYYELLIVTSVMVVGIIADGIVDRVNARVYLLDKKGFGSLTGSILISLKSNALFLVLFILCLPLIFIPGFNIVVHLFLWVMLIKTPLFYDSLAMYATREEYALLKSRNRSALFGVALAAASLFLIPVIGVFVYVLQLLFFTHFNLQRLTRMRGLHASPS